MATVDALDDGYERAEAAYLAGLRTRADWSHLADLASAVAQAASDFNSGAYAAFHSATGDERAALDALTERTEVLAELWADIAVAYSA